MQPLGGPAWRPQLLSQGGYGQRTVGILPLLTLILATAAAPVDRSRRSHRAQDPSPFPDVAVGLGCWQADNKEPSEGKDRDRAQLQRGQLCPAAPRPSPRGQLQPQSVGSVLLAAGISTFTANPLPLPHSLLPPATPLSPPVPRKGPVASGADESGLWAGSPIQSCSLICNQLATGIWKWWGKGQDIPFAATIALTSPLTSDARCPSSASLLPPPLS